MINLRKDFNGLKAFWIWTVTIITCFTMDKIQVSKWGVWWFMIMSMIIIFQDALEVKTKEMKKNGKNIKRTT